MMSIFYMWPSVKVGEDRVGLDFVERVSCGCKDWKVTHGAAVGQHKTSTDISTHCYYIQIGCNFSEDAVHSTAIFLCVQCRKFSDF